MNGSLDQLPPNLRARLEELYDSTTLKRIEEIWKTPHVTTLRTNTLKTDKNTFIKNCKQQSVELKSVAWNSNAFILISPTLREFTETSVYKNGECYVQSFSSMIPPLILNPLKNEKVLDLCAAPGSKTSQLSMLMENTGEIIANDSSHTRIYRLKANLEKLGVTNVHVTRGVGQGLWHEYPEYFDKTLVDVPCSMEGRISLTDEKSYADWSIKKIKELQEVQKFLLRSAISSTKVGGIIVYSTCTLAPEENEGVIDWILSKEAGKIALEAVELEGVPFSPGLEMWHGKTFHKEIGQTKRILPSEEFEGFYIAKFRKLAPTIPVLNR